MKRAAAESAAAYFETLQALDGRHDVAAFASLEDALVEYLDYVRRNHDPETH